MLIVTPKLRAQPMTHQRLSSPSALRPSHLDRTPFARHVKGVLGSRTILIHTIKPRSSRPHRPPQAPSVAHRQVGCFDERPVAPSSKCEAPSRFHHYLSSSLSKLYTLNISYYTFSHILPYFPQSHTCNSYQSHINLPFTKHAQHSTFIFFLHNNLHSIILFQSISPSFKTATGHGGVLNAPPVAIHTARNSSLITTRSREPSLMTIVWPWDCALAVSYH